MKGEIEMTKRMMFLLEELMALYHDMEGELPLPILKKMDTITGKFENLMIEVSKIGKEDDNDNDNDNKRSKGRSRTDTEGSL